jgi:hypothetical protein
VPALYGASSLEASNNSSIKALLRALFRALLRALLRLYLRSMVPIVSRLPIIAFSRTNLTSGVPEPRAQRQHLYFCTSKASKLSNLSKPSKPSTWRPASPSTPGFDFPPPFLLLLFCTSKASKVSTWRRAAAVALLGVDGAGCYERYFFVLVKQVK